MALRQSTIDYLQEELVKLKKQLKKNLAEGYPTQAQFNRNEIKAIEKRLEAGMATRRKNAGKYSIRKSKKRIKASESPSAALRYEVRSFKAGKKRLRKRNAGSSFNLHSLIKWGIIAGVGYFLFTKFVKPNLSGALSGIVNDPQMSWAYIDPSRMLQAQEGNPMGQMVRNRPIRVGRGVM